MCDPKGCLVRESGTRESCFLLLLSGTNDGSDKIKVIVVAVIGDCLETAEV
jgi:hypothetical protein